MSEATQQVAGLITGGILKEAVDSGYGVKDETIEAVKQAEQAPEETVEEAPAPPPDPVDEIVDSLRAQAEEKIEQAEPDEEPDPDEFDIPDFEAQANAELLNKKIATTNDDTYEPK